MMKAFGYKTFYLRFKLYSISICTVISMRVVLTSAYYCLVQHFFFVFPRALVPQQGDLG